MLGRELGQKLCDYVDTCDISHEVEFFDKTPTVGVDFDKLGLDLTCWKAEAPPYGKNSEFVHGLQGANRERTSWVRLQGGVER